MGTRPNCAYEGNTVKMKSLSAEGGARVGQPTCKLGTFFIKTLTLTEPIFNNFQENGFSVETLKL